MKRPTRGKEWPKLRAEAKAATDLNPPPLLENGDAYFFAAS